MAHLMVLPPTKLEPGKCLFPKEALTTEVSCSDLLRISS